MQVNNSAQKWRVQLEASTIDPLTQTLILNKLNSGSEALKQFFLCLADEAIVLCCGCERIFGLIKAAIVAGRRVRQLQVD